MRKEGSMIMAGQSLASLIRITLLGIVKAGKFISLTKMEMWWMLTAGF